MASVVLDAGVLIALYDDSDAHHKWAIDFLINTSERQLLMSSVNYAEVIVQPVARGLLPKLTEGIKGLGIKIASVGEESVVPLAQVRAKTALPMPDCCLIELAQKKHAAIATTDKAAAKGASGLGLAVYQP